MFSVKCKYHHMQFISSLVQLYQPQQSAPILCTICTIVKESEENGIQLLCYSGTEGSLQVIKFYTIDKSMYARNKGVGISRFILHCRQEYMQHQAKLTSVVSINSLIYKSIHLIVSQ